MYARHFEMLIYVSVLYFHFHWNNPAPVLLSSVQFSHSVMSNSLHTPWTACSTPGLHLHHQLPEFNQTHVHWVGDAIQPSHPLLSPSSPAFNLSKHQGLSNESALCIRWPNNISPSNEQSGLMSFRMDCLDLVAVPWKSQESSPTPQFKSIWTYLHRF